AHCPPFPTRRSSDLLLPGMTTVVWIIECNSGLASSMRCIQLACFALWGNRTLHVDRKLQSLAWPRLRVAPTQKTLSVQDLESVRSEEHTSELQSPDH